MMVRSPAQRLDGGERMSLRNHFPRLCPNRLKTEILDNQEDEIISTLKSFICAKAREADVFKE